MQDVFHKKKKQNKTKRSQDRPLRKRYIPENVHVARVKSPHGSSIFLAHDVTLKKKIISKLEIND